MKKTLLALSLTLALSSMGTLALAETAVTANTVSTPVATTAAPLTMVAVLKLLDQAGYKHIHNIEFDHDVYKVETFDAQGEKLTFKVAAVNGVIPAQAKPVTYITMLAAAEKLQADGYKVIHEVEFEHGMYKAKALNEKGKKVKVIVNALTGVVSKD